METQHDKEAQKFHSWINSPEYQERLTKRLEIQDACMRSREARQLTYELCKEDPIFFIENFGWTFDPRPEHWIAGSGHLPFILFDYQKEAILWVVDHIKNGHDGLIEKSRDMGVSWIMAWTFFWFWRFNDTFSGLMGSYKEALVDNRTKDSLFGMLDYCLENTPKWMLPQRFKAKDHRQKLKLVNPESHNLISGDTMNPDFARGSRKTAVVMDEGASWEYFREAWESAGDTTTCRLTLSTPKGRNAFALLRESGIDVLTIHWSKHPLKDQNWYEFQKLRRTDEEIAQELDISYHKSQEGRVYPEWDSVPMGEHPYDAELPLYVGWDFGQTDNTALIWFQVLNDDRVVVVDAYTNHGKTIDFYVPFVTGVMPIETYKYSKKDLAIIESHANWKKGVHFGDPAGRFTNQITNQSVMDVLRSYGIFVNFKEEAKDFNTRKTQAKLLMRTLLLNSNERTRELSAAMESAHYPRVRMAGQEEVRSIKPVHDWTSHYRSAFEYFAVNYNLLKGQRRQVKDKFAPRQRSGRAIGY